MFTTVYQPLLNITVCADSRYETEQFRHVDMTPDEACRQLAFVEVELMESEL